MTPENPTVSDESNSQWRIERVYDDETPPSVAIIQAISTLEDTDPIELAAEFGITLYDHIDPEALDRLATDTDGVATVTIDLGLETEHQYVIQIRETGQLVVQKAI